jgi:phage terminase large subunit-like protein
MANKGYVTVEIRQTMQNLNEPTKTFREKVASGELMHDGSPLLKSHVKNARQIVDTKENIMISKKKAGDVRRIDLLAAILDALRQHAELLKVAIALGDDFGF